MGALRLSQKLAGIELDEDDQIDWLHCGVYHVDKATGKISHESGQFVTVEFATAPELSIESNFSTKHARLKNMASGAVFPISGLFKEKGINLKPLGKKVVQGAVHPGQGAVLGNGNGQAPTPGVIGNGDELTSAAEDQQRNAGGSATALPSSMGLVQSRDRKYRRVSSIQEASNKNLMLQPKARAEASRRKMERHMSEVNRVSEVSQEVEDQDDKQDYDQEQASRYHCAGQSRVYDEAWPGGESGESPGEENKDADFGCDKRQIPRGSPRHSTKRQASLTPPNSQRLLHRWGSVASDGR